MNYFQTNTRANGEHYITMTDDRPEWLYDAVQAAHDGEMPNDWRYATCAAIVDALAEYDPTDPDAPAEIADGLTDVYTVNLLAWMAEHVYRTNYADEVLAQRNVDSLSDLMMAAQFLAIEQMAQILADAIAEEVAR